MKLPLRFSIQTRYRPEFVPAIVSFVADTAKSLGANPKEASDLALASEEAALHIIERFPGNGLESVFEIQAECTGGILRLVFGNQGLPVDTDRLPQYATDRPEEHLDGLGLFLLEKLVDRVEFVNLGRQGWRTVLEKQLTTPRFLPASATDAVPRTPPGREKLTVQHATDAHVAGIVELAYHTYGYSYAKEDFYYADRLRTAIAEGRVSSFVAVSPSGKVVGQMALLFPHAGASVCEVGALMVHPDYRRSPGLLQLIKAVMQESRQMTAPPVLAEGNLVTTHVLSQRVCASAGFKPMALKLSVHERARFVELAEEADDQRESLLHAIVTTRPAPPVSLYIPARHDDVTRRLFEAAGITLVAPDPTAPVPPQASVGVSRNAETSHGVVTVDTPGIVYATILRNELFELEADGIKTVEVRFPGWLPRPASFDDDTKNLRLFFCGWILETPERWWLQYTRINAQRFDFERIQLYDPAAIALRTYVEAQFKETVL